MHRTTTKKLTILIVDDNPNNLLSLENLILEYISQVNVLQVNSGLQALAVLMKEWVDLIILDIQMPEMDGFETAQCIRKRQKMRYVPIVFLTAAYKSDEFREKGYALGAADYLTKPIDGQELIHKVKMYLHFIRQEQLRNAELLKTNERLKQEILERQKAQIEKEKLLQENMRMGAELEIAQRLQQLVLPKKTDIETIPQLEIATLMEAATEVGGDYYDVLTYDEGILIAIGDVMGHGLESGVLMMMLQNATQTLKQHIDNIQQLLAALNVTIYHSVTRMNLNKFVTLTLLNFQQHKLQICGQHEEVLIFRKNGTLERIDTDHLGFMLGIENDISHLLHTVEIQLQPGDGIALYTDGITEASNSNKNFYGIKRLCTIIQQHWQQPAQAICEAVMIDVKQFLDSTTLQDDIAILIAKQR